MEAEGGGRGRRAVQLESDPTVGLVKKTLPLSQCPFDQLCEEPGGPMVQVGLPVQRTTERPKAGGMHDEGRLMEIGLSDDARQAVGEGGLVVLTASGGRQGAEELEMRLDKTDDVVFTEVGIVQAAQESIQSADAPLGVAGTLVVVQHAAAKRAEALNDVSRVAERVVVLDQRRACEFVDPEVALDKLEKDGVFLGNHDLDPGEREVGFEGVRGDRSLRSGHGNLSVERLVSPMPPPGPVQPRTITSGFVTPDSLIDIYDPPAPGVKETEGSPRSSSVGAGGRGRRQGQMTGADDRGR